MSATTGVMLIAAASLVYGLRVAAEGLRWRPPMPAPVVTPAAYVVWIATPLLCVALIIGWTLPAASAQPLPSSASAAQALVREMTTRHLDAIAAADPAQPGRYVAALLIPGSQLLVVSAMNPSASVIDKEIASGDYRDVYLDLQGTPTPAGKFFVQDTGADGIRDGSGGAVDVVYEDGIRQTLFDRTLAKSLPGAAYDQALNAADARYNKALVALIVAVRALPPSAATQTAVATGP